MSLMCFTETWFKCQPSRLFVWICVDAASLQYGWTENRESGKRKGGGVVLLVNNRWCHLRLFTMKEKMCSQDTELLVADLTAE